VSSTFFQVSTVLALLLLNAFLVAGEFSIIKLRLSHFNPDYLAKVRSRRWIASLLDNTDSTLRVARLGIILCTFGYAVLAFPLLTSLFEPLIEFSSGLAVIAAFGLAVVVHYVVGETVPRALAVAHPVDSLNASSWLLKFMGVAFRPFLIPLRALAVPIMKRLGAEQGPELEALDIEEQLRRSTHEPDVSSVLLRIIRNALQLRAICVQDIILPRNQVKFIDLSASIEESIALAVETGHTRFPLCDGDLDRCVGLIHIKDIFRCGTDPARLDFVNIKREIVRIEPDKTLESTLEEMLRKKIHMALVADEFGGTEGVVTLERILEQLVGEIQDEFDSEEDPIVELGDQEFQVSGLAPLRELEERLNLEIENPNEVTTFGGLIIAELGEIPHNGEELHLGQLLVKVTEVDETRIIAARVHLRGEPLEDQETVPAEPVGDAET